jgi:hypothetical protein
VSQSEEMIEAVARAICRANMPKTATLDAVDCQVENGWDLWTNEARAALTAMQPLLAQGWEPIETAPKDGTHVLVYARLGHNGKVRRSRHGCFVNVAHFEPSWGWLTSPSDYQIKPTHWRPLPAPPALEQGDAK